MEISPIAEARRGVAVIGSTTFDLNLIDGRRFAKPGGVTTYAGMTYCRHGLMTWAVTNVAADDRRVLDPLLQAGARVVGGETCATTRFVNRVVDGSRSQQIDGAASPIRASLIAAAAVQAGILHFGPLHPADIDPGVYAGLNGCPAVIVLDVQGYVRRIEGKRIVAGVSEALPPALRAARLVKSNEVELSVITAACSLNLKELMKEYDIAEWIVTSANKGGYVRSSGPGGGLFFFDGETIDTLADPTGAGDVFLAAYVWSRLAAGRSIGAAARHAAHKAAAQVAGRYIALPELPELNAPLNSGPFD